MSKNTKIVIGVVAVLAICGFVAGCVILGVSSLYLENSASQSVQYFLTVNEVLSESSMVNKRSRISGAVIGDSIEFDQLSGKLTFQIADIPADYETVEQQGGLALVLENAVSDPDRQRIQVVYVGEKPDLLRNMAQVIMIGELHSDGILYADELLLKCPSRYEAVPDQAIN